MPPCSHAKKLVVKNCQLSFFPSHSRYTYAYYTYIFIRYKQIKMSKWTIRIFSCAFCSVLLVVRVQEYYVYYIYFIIGMWIKNPIKLYDLRLWSVHILPEQRYKQIILDQYSPYSQSHIPPYSYIYMYLCCT